MSASIYRIEEPTSQLYIRLRSLPALAGDAPKVVARLVPLKYASRFPSRDAAQRAQACYVPHEPLEVVRFDA